MQEARSQLHTEDDSNEVFNDVSLFICPVLPLSKSYFPFVPSSLLPVGGNDELDEANDRKRQDGVLPSFLHSVLSFACIYTYITFRFLASINCLPSETSLLLSCALMP